MRGRSMFGLDDMGNSAASVIAAGTPTTAGSGSGAETVTIAQANLPNVNLVASSLTGSVNTALTNATGVVRNLNNPDFATFSAGAGSHDVFDGVTAETATLSLSSGTVTFGGNVPLGGSGTATNKMPPYRLGSFYFKL